MNPIIANVKPIASRRVYKPVAEPVAHQRQRMSTRRNNVSAIRERWHRQPDVAFCDECFDAAIAHARKQLEHFCHPDQAHCTYADDYGRRLPYEPARHYGEFEATPFTAASADIHALLRHIDALTERLVEQQ